MIFIKNSLLRVEEIFICEQVL